MLKFINGMINIFFLPVYHCSICISLLRWIFHTNAFILYDYFRQRLPSPFNTPAEEFDNAALFQFLAMVQTVRLTAHTSYFVTTKTELYENALQTRRTRKRRLFVFVWMENIRIFASAFFPSSFFHPQISIQIRHEDSRPEGSQWISLCLVVSCSIFFYSL